MKEVAKLQIKDRTHKGNCTTAVNHKKVTGTTLH